MNILKATLSIQIADIPHYIYSPKIGKKSLWKYQQTTIMNSSLGLFIDSMMEDSWLFDENLWKGDQICEFKGIFDQHMII